MDIVIKNGKVIDGTGNPWFKAHIGIDDGKIVEVSRHDIGGGAITIDAEGMVVTPGFINLHSHSGVTVIDGNPCENSLRQGLTTEIGGGDGRAYYGFKENLRPFIRGILREYVGYDGEVDWLTLEEYRRRVEEKGIGVNIAPFCGHETIRRSSMGCPNEYWGGRWNRPPTPEELLEMKRLLDECMRHGAFGLATGIEYTPEVTMDELVELCKVVVRYGGVHISHIRSESTFLVEAVREIIELSRITGVPSCINHHKGYNPGNWGKVSETMRLLRRAREEGIDIICDMYPWVYTEINKLKDRIPIGRGLNLEETLKLLDNYESWRKIKDELKKRHERFIPELNKRLSPPLVNNYIAHSKSHPEVEGKNLEEAAEVMGLSDGWEALRELYLSDGGESYVACRMCEDDLITVLREPFTTVSTDSCCELNPEKYGPWHPRGWGTYPLIIERYVRKLKVLSLEDAVRKMSSLPASFLGMRDRGLIREGMWADIVVFKPGEVRNLATYSDPHRYPEGIEYVIVNGELVIDRGKYTGNLPGRVLRKSGTRFN